MPKYSYIRDMLGILVAIVSFSIARATMTTANILCPALGDCRRKIQGKYSRKRVSWCIATQTITMLHTPATGRVCRLNAIH